LASAEDQDYAAFLKTTTNWVDVSILSMRSIIDVIKDKFIL
jgi:hypothetical protein